MTILATLRRILNNSPGTATNIDYNFQVLEDYINTSVLTTDGGNAATGPITIPAPPVDDSHAANKGYVDSLWHPGFIIDYGGTVAPTGWVLCNGATYSSTDPTYVALFQAIGYRYGDAGGGNFKVPPAGTFSFSTDATHAVGTGGGSADSELLSHNHTVAVGDDAPDHAHSIDFYSGPSDRGLGHQHGGNTGGAGGHNHGIPHDSLMWRYNPNGTEGATSTAITGQRRDNIAHADVGDHGHAFTTDVGYTPDHLHRIQGGTVGANVRHTHAVTVNPNGGGTTLTGKNMPPYSTVSRLIKL